MTPRTLRVHHNPDGSGGGGRRWAMAGGPGLGGGGRGYTVGCGCGCGWGAAISSDAPTRKPAVHAAYDYLCGRWRRGRRGMEMNAVPHNKCCKIQPSMLASICRRARPRAFWLGELTNSTSACGWPFRAQHHLRTQWFRACAERSRCVPRLPYDGVQARNGSNPLPLLHWSWIAVVPPEAVETDDLDVTGVVKLIRECGMEVGIAIKPVPGSRRLSVIALVDIVLVMTVEPGLVVSSCPTACRRCLRPHEHPNLDIQVDGGPPGCIDAAAAAGPI